MPEAQTKSIGEMETKSFLTAMFPITTAMDITADIMVGIHPTEGIPGMEEGVPIAGGRYAPRRCY